MKRFFPFILMMALTLGLLQSCGEEDSNLPYPTPTPINNNDDDIIKELEKAKKIELTVEGIQGVKAQNEFAFSVFKEMYLNDTEENILLSPISLTTCLSMLANATSEDATQQTIARLMGGGIDLDKFNEVNQHLLSELTSIDPSTNFVTSNSAWLHNSYSFLPEFEEKVKNYYNAKTSILDLYSGSSADIINNWACESTNGLIPTLFEGAPSSPFVLANALYFKAGWVAEFNPKNSKNKTFHNIDGSEEEVDMMTMESGPFSFYYDDKCSAVELPYGNKAFSFYAVLPEESIGFSTFLNDFDNEKWDDIVSKIYTTNVDVELPKFDASYDNYRLGTYLACLGLDKTFGNDGRIPFLANNDIKGDMKCFQKNSFKVTEAGAEGASILSLIMATIGEEGGGVAGKKPEIKLNRPFLYVVAEKSTGAIIFIGSVVKL